MPSYNFNPAVDIPSLAGRVVLITGGTAGLGRETVLAFAAHSPKHVFFTGRSQPSADQLIKDVASTFPDVPVTFIHCELASLASTQAAARQLLSQTDRLDISVMNAGVMSLPLGLTKDGYEIQFGTNHVGHALLAKLLTPLLTTTAAQNNDVRIIWLSSMGYKFHPTGGILFDKLKTPQADISYFMGDWTRYGQSKLANILYARAFAKHYPHITSVSLHPGMAATRLVDSAGFWNRLVVHVATLGQMMTVEECAWNQQWAATAALGKGERQVDSGKYYTPVGVEGGLSGPAGDDELAEKLWAWTKEAMKEFEL